MNDAQGMELCLALAERAESEGEVPVGAILVRDGQVLGQGWNRTVRLSDPSAHAEVIALRDAGRRTGNHRLVGATLFATLEPCLMCFGALLEARISRLVIGAPDARRGGLALWQQGQLDFYPAAALDVVEGVEAERCLDLLRGFFRARRS